MVTWQEPTEENATSTEYKYLHLEVLLILLQCRFVDYQPAKISALAFSHPSNSKQPPPASLLLAVGRSNGDIDLWSPLYEWVHKTVLPHPLSTSFNCRL